MVGHPFRKLIHGPLRTNSKAVLYRSLRSLLHLLFPVPSKRDTPPLSLSYGFLKSESAAHFPSPAYLHRSYFSIYGPEVQMERLDFKTNWISKLSTTPRQFSSDFQIGDRFWRGTTEFAWSGALLNVQLNI
ncbi:hypothetical protein AVEN_200258-1 [Araneus ventricosus]|uniref:Uncharacterized protein n=1 Tax=Araneus ventricosus TaxID=182803 RepID=A0A4Y2DUG1_ARAVE|nr:hypothetical protein AVEN_200258-1 [Araneus ventricosus]